MKALGCGIGATAGLHDVIVTREPSGKPAVHLSMSAKLKLGWVSDEELEAGSGQEEDGRRRIHITITHDRGLASAFVVIEQLD